MQNLTMSSYSEILQFDKKQKEDWQLAFENYRDLKNVKVREFEIDGKIVIAQFNSKRVRSATAKVDQKSISKRPCFLCDKNRPLEQLKMPLFKDYQLLINPFPIFEKHFTIPKIEHTPQTIVNHFEDMLVLSKIMEGFDIFYNGPWCGASAPDHFHFQGIEKNCLPLMRGSFNSESLISEKDIQVEAIEESIYKCFVISGNDEECISSMFYSILEFLKIPESEYEARMNVLATFENGKWKVILVPRDTHRPHHYNEAGDKQFRISPACVEVSGIIALAFEDDFNRLNEKVIKEVFDEVLLNEKEFSSLKNKIKSLS